MKTSSRKLFDTICLSAAAGLILYWVMFTTVLPRLMRPEALTILPLISGVIGTASCALIYLGGGNIITSIRSKSKPKETMVLRRGESGRVVSVGWAEAGYVTKAKEPKAKKVKLIKKKPQAQKGGKAKYVGVAILAALILGGYTSTMVLTGYTLQDVMNGMYSPFMAVSSGSMQPVLNEGDLIVVRREAAKNIAVGDIIVFNVPSPHDRMTQSPIVHRVVEKWEENGETYFKTKGDKNSNEDSWAVPAENLIGKYAGKVPYLGSVALSLRFPFGLVLIVPLLVLSVLYSHSKKKKAKQAQGGQKDE
jgi:signal peptidase